MLPSQYQCSLILPEFFLPFLHSDIVFLPFSYYFSTEEKHTHAGHQIQVLNNLIMGQELTIFSVLDHVCIKSMACKAITL